MEDNIRSLRRRDFLGLNLALVPTSRFYELLEDALSERRRLSVTFVNPDTTLRAARNSKLREMINGFDLVLPDGWGVVYGARALGLDVGPRQSNDDVCPGVFGLCARTRRSVFLFGGALGVAERAAATLSEHFPTLRVAGVLDGQMDVRSGHPGRYDEHDLALIVEAINRAQPDLVLISVPTPLQHEFVRVAGPDLLAPVLLTGGAYLDHLAESLDWYPAAISRLKLGWLYRLCREPRRLWRRYTIELLQYVSLIARQYMMSRRTQLKQDSVGCQS